MSDSTIITLAFLAMMTIVIVVAIWRTTGESTGVTRDASPRFRPWGFRSETTTTTTTPHMPPNTIIRQGDKARDSK